MKASHTSGTDKRGKIHIGESDSPNAHTQAHRVTQYTVSAGAPTTGGVALRPTNSPMKSELIERTIVSSIIEMRCLGKEKVECRPAKFTKKAISTSAGNT